MLVKIRNTFLVVLCFMALVVNYVFAQDFQLLSGSLGETLVSSSAQDDSRSEFSLQSGTVAMTSSSFFENSQAGVDQAVQDSIIVSNVRSNSATVTWVSSMSQRGFVVLNLNNSQQVAYDVRGSEYNGRVHSVKITGLTPETSYTFKVISDDSYYDNAGQYYSFTTGAGLMPEVKNDTFYGRLFQGDGITIATEALVYLKVVDKDNLGDLGESALESVLVDENGYWHYNFANLRTADALKWFEYSDQVDEIEIEILGADGVTVNKVITTDSDPNVEDIPVTNNNAPTLDLIADIVIDEGQIVTFNPTANDPDGDTLTITYSGWMDSANYQTDYTDAGSYTVTVSVFDGTITVFQDVTVNVNGVNRAPVIAPIAAITVDEGQTVSLSPVYNDPDGDSLAVVYSGWMNTDSYTTLSTDVGTHTVTITVSDGQLSVSTNVDITVNDINQSPVISPAVPNPNAMVEDTAIVIDLTAYESDPDGESAADLKWTAAGFDNGTVSGENSTDDLLVFTPNADFFGTDTVTLTLTDKEGLADTQDITLTWESANDPLIVSDIEDQTFIEGSIDQSIDLDSYVSDIEDADAAITWTVSGNSNLDVSIDADTHLVRIVSNVGWRGTETLTFTATDTGGASTSDTCVITISPLYGTVSGTVTDQISSNPVSGITVKLLDPQDSSEIATMITDANGAYRFEDVLSQAYHVYVDTAGFNFDAEYYDDAKDIATATEILVVGEDLVNINFALIDLETIDLSLNSNYNLLSFSVVPLELKDATNASDVVNYFALNSVGVDSIKQWNGEEWQTYKTDLSFTDFDFDFKYGFAAQLTSSTNLTMEGINIKLPYTIQLEQGWNLINVPVSVGAITYNNLASAMNLAGAGLTEFILLELQNLNHYSVDSFELDDNIEPGKAFFVKCDNQIDFSFE